MKTFLLITAVVTAGFIPQLALCNAQDALTTAAKAAQIAQIKMDYPGVSPAEVNPALASAPVIGQSGGYQVKHLPCQKDKVVSGGDKVLPEDHRNSAGRAQAAF